MYNKRELFKRITIIFSICLIIVVTIYFSGGGGGFLNFWNAFGPELGGSLISFLFGFLIWGWLDKHERAKEIAGLENQIDLLSQKFEQYNITLSSIQDKTEAHTKMYEVINSQHIKVRNLIHHIVKSKPFVTRYYTEIMSSYHDLFGVEDNGFLIKDEYLSLISYINFWNYMVARQKDLKEIAELTNINSKDNCLIARVVHSNSIDIWTNEHDKYKEFTNQLLKLQKEFVENEGIIVRIFLGADSMPNEKYKIAIAKMNENKIEAKYLQQTQFNKLPYDFLLLYDENFVYQWNADTVGNSLAGTVIRDSVDKIIIQKWDYLFHDLRNLNDPIISIPPNREYHLKKKM